MTVRSPLTFADPSHLEAAAVRIRELGVEVEVADGVLLVTGAPSPDQWRSAAKIIWAIPARRGQQLAPPRWVPWMWLGLITWVACLVRCG